MAKTWATKCCSGTYKNNYQLCCGIKALVCDYDDGMRGIMPKAELGTPTPVSFEDETVWGVQDYDTYLTRKYGDYMVIPKQSGQRQHNFHYLDLDKPYREYGA